MNLIKYFVAVVMLALLTACGGGGGSPGLPSGSANKTALFTTAPASLNLAGGATSPSYTISGGIEPYVASSDTPSSVGVSLSGSSFTITATAGTSGTGSVTIVDSAGTKVTVSVTVPSPAALFTTAPSTLNMGAGTTSGAAYQVSGGTKPYAVSSSDARIATGVVDPTSFLLTINALSAGTATLRISDALGASYPVTVVVDNDGGTAASAASTIDILASGNSMNSAPGSLISFLVTVKDRLNTALPAQTVTFSASSGTLSGANPSPVTGASGTISTVTLSPGTDASNRYITVTAATGLVSKSIGVPVVGTTLTVSGPGAALLGSTPQSFTVKASDSSGKPIVGASLAIASAKGNGISPSTVTTDSSGVGTFSFTASNTGADTLTATGLGATGKATVNVSNVDFSFVAPAVAASMNVGAANPVTVLYRVAGVGVAGQTVSFAATRGALSATTTVTDAFGQATVNVSSTTAGPVTLSAQTTTSSGTASTSLAAAFVATVPAALVLQANPSAVLPNAPGSTTNQSALTAVVRDAVGNPVQGQVVNFSAVADGSSGSISPGSATTDAYGVATAQFIAGPLSTATDGVQIRATVQSAATITGTASLTVNGSALFISIARSGTLTPIDSTTYQKDFSVYVTDATGAPAGNRVVTLSVWPTAYGKGNLVFPAPSGPWSYAIGSPTVCPNEDINQNGNLDLVPAEDTNNNGKLDPGNPAVITPSVTTDALGFASFTLRYGKNYAMWLSSQIIAKSLVSGTESRQLQNYDLEMLADDATSPSAPANVISPFGTASVCTNPN